MQLLGFVISGRYREKTGWTGVLDCLKKSYLCSGSRYYAYMSDQKKTTDFRITLQQLMYQHPQQNTRCLENIPDPAFVADSVLNFTKDSSRVCSHFLCKSYKKPCGRCRKPVVLGLVLVTRTCSESSFLSTPSAMFIFIVWYILSNGHAICT